MRVAVTGSNGLLGRAVVAELQANDHDVVAITRKNINYNDHEELIAAFNDVNAIVHTAGVILSRGEQQRRPAETLVENIALDIAVTKASHVADVGTIVLCSSILAYGSASGELTESMIYEAGFPPATRQYGHAKRTTCLLAEAMQYQYGKNVVSLIFPNLYGPHDKFDYEPPPLVPNVLLQVSEALTKKAPSLHGGDNGSVELELLHARDAARAIVALLGVQKIPPVLNVPSRSNTIREVYEAAARVVGYTGNITWDDTLTQKTPAKKLDGTALRSLIEWDVTITLIEGVKEVWDTYKNTNNSM
jgi:GDP-L-fucose synthase